MFFTHNRSRRDKAIALATGLACAAVALFLTGKPASAEDVAIICGVNQYPGLRPGSNLGGCINDAKLFASKLKNYGFKESNIVSLYDGDANRDRILAAIKSAKVTNRDRIVFYFAGHGTVGTDGDSVILPGNASDTNESNDIPTKDLYEAVKALPARSKTVVLDSCHSGGMVRGTKGVTISKGNRARLYLRSARMSRGTKAWVETDANNADVIGDQTGTPDAKICYFTAALKTQTAAETDFGGEQHGVFTYSLAKNMTGKASLWQDLSATVSGDVATATDGEQQPVLYPTDFLQKVAFDQSMGPAPAPKPQPVTLEDLFALNAPNPSMVSLKFDRTLSPVRVKQDLFRFDVTVGAPGYLVVINKDPKGLLTLMHPRSAAGELSAAQVTAGQNIGLPLDPAKKVYADTPGIDSVKALLFTDPSAARAMIRSFSQGPIPTTRQMKRGTKKQREWVETEVKPAPAAAYYTSEVVTQIIDPAAAGSGITAGAAAP